MKKYKVYCGFLDWYVVVEASSMEQAIEEGHRKMLKRIEDGKGDMWADEIPASPLRRSGGQS